MTRLSLLNRKLIQTESLKRWQCIMLDKAAGKSILELWSSLRGSTSPTIKYLKLLMQKLPFQTGKLRQCSVKQAFTLPAKFLHAEAFRDTMCCSPWICPTWTLLCPIKKKCILLELRLRGEGIHRQRRKRAYSLFVFNSQCLFILDGCVREFSLV